jgi:hypothetical protein
MWPASGTADKSIGTRNRPTGVLSDLPKRPPRHGLAGEFLKTVYAEG